MYLGFAWLVFVVGSGMSCSLGYCGWLVLLVCVLLCVGHRC